MTVTLKLDSHRERRLADLAAASGEDVQTLLQRWLVRELDQPRPLLDASEPLAKAIDASGMDDAHYLALLTRMQAESRQAAR